MLFSEFGLFHLYPSSSEGDAAESGHQVELGRQGLHTQGVKGEGERGAAGRSDQRSSFHLELDNEMALTRHENLVTSTQKAVDTFYCIYLETGGFV